MATTMMSAQCQRQVSAKQNVSARGHTVGTWHSRSGKFTQFALHHDNLSPCHMPAIMQAIHADMVMVACSMSKSHENPFSCKAHRWHDALIQGVSEGATPVIMALCFIPDEAGVGVVRKGHSSNDQIEPPLSTREEAHCKKLDAEEDQRHYSQQQASQPVGLPRHCADLFQEIRPSVHVSGCSNQPWAIVHLLLHLLTSNCLP